MREYRHCAQWATDEKSALAAYWAAKTPREEHAAYHEIKLFGGHDGYSVTHLRSVLARTLRRLALWAEGEK